MPTLETQIGLSLFKDCLNFFNVSALKNLCKSQNHLPAYVASSLEIIAPFVELLTQHQINFRDNSFFREKAQLSFTKKSKSTSPLRPPPLTSPYNEEVFKQLVPIFFFNSVKFAGLHTSTRIWSSMLAHGIKFRAGNLIAGVFLSLLLLVLCACYLFCHTLPGVKV